MKNGLDEYRKPMEALYDLYYDAEEMHNLIDDIRYEDIKNNLKDKLNKMMEDINDPLLKGELPGYKVNKRECIMASSKNPEDYDVRGRY